MWRPADDDRLRVHAHVVSPALDKSAPASGMQGLILVGRVPVAVTN
ncbi:hypothetical protein HMPREF9607_00148 [Cutibacterium modestum HL044PA1]|uniref:Uncharacterized protein n=1 Tax=Cutibacterium modestum HL044PA1 TaxID=765109 RepID=A0ABP2KCD8_9ACTN|nr:hypothetical protein HMPREF9607_00148 [Cutibacterium modestum HL044PA1]